MKELVVISDEINIRKLIHVFFSLMESYWTLLIVSKLNHLNFKQKYYTLSHYTTSCGNLFYIAIALWKN